MLIMAVPVSWYQSTWGRNIMLLFSSINGSEPVVWVVFTRPDIVICAELTAVDTKLIVDCNVIVMTFGPSA